MALSKAFETFERPGLVVSYKLANVKIYKGANVGVNVSGFLVSMSHATTGLKYVGIANDSVDNSAGANGDKSMNVTKTGSFVLKAAAGFTPTQADIGKEVYAVTDWEVQVSLGGLTFAYKVGTIVGIERTSTGELGVRIRNDRHSV